MADPLSISSGILTLAVFALHSSQRLYRTIESFKSNKRVVRELGQELVALQGVLESLQETIDSSNADFKALHLPLLRCGKACEEFDVVIAKCASDSSGVRAIRDWAKVRYMGDDINGFRVLIGSYKSTITIAICDVNMRTTNITANLLSEYKKLIEETTSELEDQLGEINKKLDQLTIPHPENVSNIMVFGQVAEEDKEGIEEDKRSIEQCLEICVQVSEHIDRVQRGSALNARQRSSDAGNPSTATLAKQITTDALTGCKIELNNTTSALQKQLEEIQLRLTAISTRSEIAGNTGEEELESIKQCIAICSQASEQAKSNRIHVFEDITSEDDAEQVIVATMGDLLSAKRVTSGNRSVQWLGQMSDASLVQLASRRTPPLPPAVQKATNEQQVLKFEGRHGSGHRLNN